MASLIISERTTHTAAGQTIGLVMITLGAILLQLAGFDSQTPSVTAALSVLLMVAGLPHGSFDLALLRQSTRQGAGPVLLLVLLYLGCAGAMYLVWQLAPGLALAAFLLMAILHFAEVGPRAARVFLPLAWRRPSLQPRRLPTPANCAACSPR